MKQHKRQVRPGVAVAASALGLLLVLAALAGPAVRTREQEQPAPSHTPWPLPPAKQTAIAMDIEWLSQTPPPDLPSDLYPPPQTPARTATTGVPRGPWGLLELGGPPLPGIDYYSSGILTNTWVQGNAWRQMLGHRLIVVTTGVVASLPMQTPVPPGQRQGLLLVFSQEIGSREGRRERFYSPRATGLLRVIDATNQGLITLSSIGGTYFRFDIRSRRFQEIPAGTVPASATPTPTRRH